jgi:hypothetical protein
MWKRVAIAHRQQNTLNCQVLMAEESRCSWYCNKPPVTLLIAMKVNMQDKKNKGSTTEYGINHVRQRVSFTLVWMLGLLVVIGR